MIEDILPAVAVAAESFGPPGDRELFPAEAAVVTTADPVRRREFAAGRAVAHAALARLHAPAGPVLSGRAGEPLWPDGVVGSITHCAGYRACAVAPARDMAAIGIDAEPCLALDRGLLKAVAGDAERVWLAELSAACPETPWDRVLFCAKESVYKAWYPHTGERPGPHGITVRISQAGTFAAALPRVSATSASGHPHVSAAPASGHPRGSAAPPSGHPRVSATPAQPHPGASAAAPPVARLAGRWLVDRGLIVTAVSIPA